MTDWRRKLAKDIAKTWIRFLEGPESKSKEEQATEVFYEKICQAEPERKGLEECVEAILDKHKEDFPLMDVKCGNELRSSLLEILRTLAPECHIEAAAEEILERFIKSWVHVKLENNQLSMHFDKERMREEIIPILRKHLRDAPEPGEDEEAWASRVISDLKKIGDGDTILEIDEEGAVTDPKDAKLIKHLIACLRSLPKPAPVGEVGEILEELNRFHSGHKDRTEIRVSSDWRHAMNKIQKAIRTIEAQQRKIEGLREQLDSYRMDRKEPTPDE